MEHVSAWLGAGVVTAGMSAALLAGAGVATADPDSGSDSGGAGSSESAKSSADKADSAPAAKDAKDPDTSEKSDKTDTENAASNSASDPDESETGESDGPDSTDPVDDEDTGEAPEDPEAQAPEAEAPETPVTPVTPVTDEVTGRDAAPTDNKSPAAASAPSVPSVPHAAEAPEPETASEAAVVEPPTGETPADPAVAADPAVVDGALDVAAPVALRTAESTTALTFSRASAAADIAASPADLAASLLGFVGSIIGSVVINVGSIALTALQAVEALAAGPPVLPPGSTVTVRDSWITLGNGQRIAANWYYPEGDTPPEKLILLQHGLLALGPMYSFTAANLAERTGAIVVTPSITSNIFLGDDHWLGGIGMAEEIAALFKGDRAALTQSAVDAGFADRYGLSPDAAALPREFALVGHSLGGHLVSAAAGFLAANGGAENLVGVISLDGVPLGTTMPDALAKLDVYENSQGGRYIPIREIGAPWNIYNAFSDINEALSAARPDHFNGVVLAGGVHMDSMQGGNPIIQFAAYVAAGFPQPQNPPAVQELAVQWLDEWFGGDPFVGDGVLTPGSTVEIETPQGTAIGTVIGDPPAARLPRRLDDPFPVTAPTDIPEPAALLTALAV